MIVFFTLLFSVAVWQGWHLWRERDRGGLSALLSLAVIAAAAGTYYYFVHSR